MKINKLIVSTSFLFLVVSACNNKTETTETKSETSDSTHNVTIGDIKEGEVDIMGDFDGDNIMETGFAKVYREGVLQESPSLVALSFPSFPFDTLFFTVAFEGMQEAPMTGYYEFINEGNIDGFPGDELTVYSQAEVGAGQTAAVQTFTLRNGQWKALFDEFYTVDQSNEDLKKQDLVFNDNNEIIYYQYIIDEKTNDVKPERIKPKLIKAAAQGDFDGDRLLEYANLKVKIKGDDWSDWTYLVQFSNPNMKPLTIESSTDEIELVNEGNLDNKVGDELSVKKTDFRSGTHAPFLYPFSFRNGKWVAAMDSVFLSLNDSLNLHNYITKENNQVYFHLFYPDWNLVGIEDAEKAELEKSQYSKVNAVIR